MPSKKSSFLAICLCLVVAGFGTAKARAEDQGDFLKISVDHARVLKLDRPVSKVIIGNDHIADATVADNQTIVLTGKDFGMTNLVLLDSEGNAIVDERVLVALDETKTIRLFRQADRVILSCTPACEARTKSSSAAVSVPAAVSGSGG